MLAGAELDVVTLTSIGAGRVLVAPSSATAVELLGPLGAGGLVWWCGMMLS